MIILSAGGTYIKSTLDEDVPNLSAIKGNSAPFVPKLRLPLVLNTSNHWLKITWVLFGLISNILENKQQS
jgi:hypothetical protein